MRSGQWEASKGYHGEHEMIASNQIDIVEVETFDRDFGKESDAPTARFWNLQSTLVRLRILTGSTVGMIFFFSRMFGQWTVESDAVRSILGILLHSIDLAFYVEYLYSILQVFIQRRFLAFCRRHLPDPSTTP